MALITIEEAKKLNPDLNPELFLPSPLDVLKAIENNWIVKEWHKFIAREHKAREAKILLFVPCTPKKPYDPPRDELHKKLIELEMEYDVYIVSVSEPLALEPREFWNFKWRRKGKNINLIYDAPFFPWIEKYGYTWREDIAEKVWSKLSRVVKKWYTRNNIFDCAVCLAFPDTGYRKILDKIEVDYFVPEFKVKSRENYSSNTDEDYLREDIWKKLIKILRDI